MGFLPLLSLLFCFALADQATIVLPEGTVQGNILQGCREFAGIPYAEPPVGSLRWADPKPKAAWNSVIYTQKFSAGCPQNCSTPPHTCPTSYSEDCLYLNVYTPLQQAISSPLPVMVWFHGGEFEVGAGGVPIYNASYIAAVQNVVVVTVNYRLGALGFLASTNPQLSGSWGFKDQQLAMLWVQQHAIYFGGDKTNVIIFGQSAGATSTSSHLVCDASDPYFHKAIIESNPFALPLKTPDQAEIVTKKFANYLKCDPSDLNCLRSQSIDMILQAQNYAEVTFNNTDILNLFYPWVPVIDGVLIKDHPITLFHEGNYQKTKPILMGTVLEEGWLFIFEVFPTTPVSDSVYEAAAYGLFGPNTPKVLSLYPPTGADNRPQAALLATDFVFFCANRYVTHAISDFAQAPVWVYRFDQVISFDAWGDVNPYCVGHVCHGSELGYVYHSWSYDNSGYTVTPEEQVLADTITLYWANFAKTGNPNTPAPASPPADFINWPQYSWSSNTLITMNATFGYAQNYREQYCDFFDALGSVPYITPYD